MGRAWPRLAGRHTGAVSGAGRYDFSGGESGKPISMTKVDFSALPDVPTDSSPETLRTLAESHWQNFVASGQTLPEVLCRDLPIVWTGSDYLAEQMVLRPALTQWLAQPERLRSEEHTSELQSRPHLVCRLLLEKKKEHHYPGYAGIT